MSSENKTNPLALADEFISKVLSDKEICPFFIFDFDGTLADYQNDPAKVNLIPSLSDGLKQLQKHYPNRIMILSGRRYTDLIDLFNGHELFLTGEHGAESNFMNLIIDQNALSSPEVMGFLSELVRQNEGCFLEEKHYSKVFHFRRAKIEIGDDTALMWRDELNQLLNKSSMRCYLFNKVLEIKSSICTKKNYVTELRKGLSPTTKLICFGDDLPEQEIFDQWSTDELISIGVGRRITRATYRLENPHELGVWLNRIANY